MPMAGCTQSNRSTGSRDAMATAASSHHEIATHTKLHRTNQTTSNNNNNATNGCELTMSANDKQIMTRTCGHDEANCVGLCILC